MQEFETNPILNPPHLMPSRHWELDDGGMPTGKASTGRRASSYLVPIPAPGRGRNKRQLELESYELAKNTLVNNIRNQVDAWRRLAPEKWNVRYATQRLLEHWRGRQPQPKLFFCQIEAAETLIWLNEVASRTSHGRELLASIRESNWAANPGLFRLASKMATGAGKTTVMAMIIAYHAVNKSRSPQSEIFSDHFLVITPGITIRDRLRVLLPQDPNNYYEKNRIVPPDMVQDVRKAQVVVTNYHALQRRETLKLSKKEREVLTGHSPRLPTLETDGQMLMRVCPQLLRVKNAIVINDEAHHCYRSKPDTDEESNIAAEEKVEAKRNKDTARVWISGIEALANRINLRTVYDLSATPFFLRGSGYPEGRLFPWVVSDFSLMDAMECGIVKLPRVPVDDATTTPDKLPVYRNVFVHIRKELPRGNRKKQQDLDPAALPTVLMGVLTALYDKYQERHLAWQKTSGIDVPPVFIIICNNTAVSKLVYDRISGYRAGDGWKQGDFPLFNNIDDSGQPLARPRTLLIDSYQLESGEALSKEFRNVAADEIALFKEEMRLRHPDRKTENLTDDTLLREVMNTVGKKGRLGEQIRCVVSVSMLTEGWDASNVTHILGIRSFSTQLLCEQAVGRALRRISYDVDEESEMLSPEYADICGVPFNFMPSSVSPAPKPPKPSIRVHSLKEREHLAIEYPRVRGYKMRPPEQSLAAQFSDDSCMVIGPEDAPPTAEMASIIGQKQTLTLQALKAERENKVVFYLASRTARLFASEREEELVCPSYFRDLVPIVRHWLHNYLTTTGDTFMQYLLWEKIADRAAEIICRACTVSSGPEQLLPDIDRFSPAGSTFDVDYQTRASLLHETHEGKSHINIAACDSNWEMEFCRLLEEDPGVFSYVRNAGLGFEVPYRYRQQDRIYEPDFIVLADDGQGPSDLLRLVVEIKGFRKEDARVKADTMNTRWIPAVNNDGSWGRWAFAEITDMSNAREKLASFTGRGEKR